MEKIIDIIIVLLSFKESFLLGLIMIAYIGYRKIKNQNITQGATEAVRMLDEKWQKKYKIIKDQLDAVFEERNDKIKTENEFAKPQETPNKIVQYGGWIIEDYGGYYTILDKEMKVYPKMFHNIEEVHRTIDALSINLTDTWKKI
jgi:hypothetical protein